MTKGPWKYEKAEGHHHVLMGEESLDVNLESDARAIALVPEMIELLKDIAEECPYDTIGYSIRAEDLLEKLRKKK